MRITGTHVYHMLRCSHAVALDLHEDRSKRRPVTEVEEFVRRRGRDWEAEFVADLDYSEPEYERGDFDSGAAQTEAFLRDGVIGVMQGVLVGDRRLGIPDLLRREPGESKFGDYHYVVGDIKSSGQPRSDQVLQVAFYSRMLADLQGREPEFGYLILKDGREERFDLRDFAAAIEEVEGRALALAADGSASEPFLRPACSGCHWSLVCVPQMEAANDLSLLQGMTPGLRETLRRIGFASCDALPSMVVESTARRSHLEPALLRKLKKGAEARAAGRPVWTRRSKQREFGEAAVVYHLYDPFAERVLFFGIAFPASVDGEVFSACPATKADEVPEFLALVDRLPRAVPLLHYGEGLRRWFSTAVSKRTRGIESRLVDLARRVRGAAIYQGPVFGLAEHVRYLLDLDPHREGEADATAMWAERPEGQSWAENKGRSDLADLCRLVEVVREHEREGAH